jgi:uncharacterized protein YbaP (TraB family)
MTYLRALALLAAAAFAAPAFAEPVSPAKAPAMWRISDADSKIYLFGTFHALPKDVVWKTAAFDAAMAECRITAIETDTDSAYAKSSIAAMLLEHGLNPSWQTLRGVLGGERYAKLADVAKKHGVPMENLARFRPWFATLTLSVHVAQAAGFDAKLGVERVIIPIAREQKDKILMMETPEAQIKALATLDGPEVLDNFDYAIADLVDFNGKIQPQLAAWRSGDLDTLDKLSAAPMRNTAPAAYRAMLVNRNANWVPRIETWLQGKGNYFVAVGAAHLAGPDSVIAMLAKKGIKAERVQ